MPARSLPLSTLIIGTRQSKLALWQTEHIIALLQSAWPGLICHLHHFVTVGDRVLDKPLPEIGGKGLFTAELENALLNREIDLAVHSLKDLPVEDAIGLTIGAIPERADVGDVLISRHGWTLQTLPHNAVVGTSSTRRQAQLLAARPDLQVRSMRGNIDTRINKVLRGDYDAAILAAAGLDRLGLIEHISERLSLEQMLPAPGQGALAVQCRADDGRVLTILSAINHSATRAAVTAERAFLSALGGGCSAPVAAYAEVQQAGEHKTLFLRGLVASIDGRQTVHVHGEGSDPHEVGRKIADHALAQGAAEILQAAREIPKPVPLSPSPTNQQPLAGKRILITRAATQTDQLTARLRELGATPLRFPVMEIAPYADLSELDAALAELGSYDWVIFTSKHAVEIVCGRPRTAMLVSRPEHSPQIAAVGPATAKALQKHGITIDFTPSQYSGAALAQQLSEVENKRMLLPRSVEGRAELPSILRARGAQVDDLPIYQPVGIELADEAWEILAQGVDVITFTSGSTVRYFVENLQRDGRFLPLLSSAKLVCIGPSTAQTAQELGLAVAVLAEEASIDGLVESIVRVAG